jgi:hypothetical protein
MVHIPSSMGTFMSFDEAMKWAAANLAYFARGPRPGQCVQESALRCKAAIERARAAARLMTLVGWPTRFRGNAGHAGLRCPMRLMQQHAHCEIVVQALAAPTGYGCLWRDDYVALGKVGD